MFNVSILQVAIDDAVSATERIAHVRKLLRSAPGNPDLVVLPELWATGFANFEQYAADANTLAPDLLQLGSESAHELGCAVHLGSMILRGSDGKLCNTALVFDRAGERIHTYAKVHPFGAEQNYVARGEAAPVVDLPDFPAVKLASNICFDLRFGALWDRQRERGANLFVNPAAWPLERGKQREALAIARAIEQQSFVVLADCTGEDGGIELSGHSMIVSPIGEVISAATDRSEQWVHAELDIDEAARLRENFPVFGSRLADYTNL